MQARYYDPVIGRFYSNDPLDAAAHMGTQNGIHGFNRYSYAINNPLKYTDPSGLCVVSENLRGCGPFGLNPNTPTVTIENSGAIFKGRMEDGTPRYEVTASLSSLYNDAITGAEIGLLRSDMNDLQMDTGYLTLGLASIPAAGGLGLGQLSTRVSLMTPVEKKTLFLAVDLALSVTVAQMRKQSLSEQLPGTAGSVIEKVRVLKGGMKVFPKPRKRVYPAK